MAIGINDLDDDDLMEEQQSNYTQEQNEPPIESQDNDEFISDFLKTKGIDDISKIKFEDEDGNIQEKSWDSLTKEERFNILNTPLEMESENNNISQENNNNDLSEEEINLLNQIRQSNLTPSQYLEQFQGSQQQEPQYKVDDLSDDEIFILDLESRVGEISDEEAANALNVAKQNEDLFKKQVEGIRKEYKEREDFQIQQQQLEQEQQQQEAYNQYQDAVINSINQFNTIGNLDLNLEDADKEELAQFMLSRDESGNNYLYQALQDPETLVKAAWFILNGEDALNNISEYFVNQIKLISQNQYKKGLEDGKAGKTVSTKPTVVINNNKKPQHVAYKSINDLDDDE